MSDQFLLAAADDEITRLQTRIEQLEKHKRLQMEDVMNLGAQLGQAWQRIKQLEAALREIAKDDDGPITMAKIARAALDNLCVDEGCPNAGTPHVCINRAADRIEQLKADLQQLKGWIERNRNPARIEQLEAALRHIAREGDHVSRAAICNTAEQALRSSPSKDWCLNMARLEGEAGDPEIGAGSRQENDDVYPGFRGNNEA